MQNPELIKLDTSNELLSIGEAAEKCGVHIDTLRRWDRKGLISVDKTIGGHRRYRIADLEQFLTNPGRIKSMSFVEKANILRDERLKEEELLKQKQNDKSMQLADQEKKLKEIEFIKNQELFEVMKQFDKFPISNNSETLGVGHTNTLDGKQYVCIKLETGSSSIMRSWRELGSAFFTARYFAEEDKYLLRQYERRNQNNSRVLGEYKSLDSLMESLATEISKL